MSSGGAPRRARGLALLVAVALVTGGCLFGEDKEVCRALRAEPADLGEITVQSGTETEDATWFSVLTTGVLAADAESRDAMAAAVAADPAGFQRVVAAVEGLDEPLTLLHDLAADAATGAAMSSAPETVDAVRDLSAYVDAECDG